jgi:hypothetical protein
MRQPFQIEVEYDINQPVSGAHAICFLYTSDGINVFGSGDADCAPERLSRREKGRYRGRFSIPACLLGEDWYFITMSLSVPFVHTYDRREAILGFEIYDSKSTGRELEHKRRPGILGIDLPWSVDKLN